MRTSEVTAVASDQLGWFPYSSGTIIERLGDLGYMFPWMLGLDGDIVRGLRCYEDNEISWLSPHVLQCALGIGVEEHDGSEIVIRPSLAFQGELIQVLGAVGTLEVFDATGRLVRTYLTSGQLTFDLDRSGAYLLRLTSVRGELAIGRVLVL